MTVHTRFDMRALGRLPAGKMNKTEAQYAQHLALRQRDGDIVWYRFEGLKFRLADNTFYSPDFAVMRANGEIELHEVKGFMMDDANVKVKVAADQYPFQFFVVRKSKIGWTMTPVSHRVPSTQLENAEHERAQHRT
jgi:hypothetical protein